MSTNSSEKSYYEILGVSKDATFEEMKIKYRKIMKDCHPDRLPEDKKEWGTMRTKEVNEAWETLKDPQKREMYDRFGSSGSPFGMPGGGDGMGDINDILNEMLNKARGGGSRSRSQQVPPVRVYVNVTLENVYNGTQTKALVNRYSLCKTCDATGFSDKKKHNCTACKGQGFTFHTQQVGPGFVQQFQMKCQTCKGSGLDVKSSLACKGCSGEKIITETLDIEFNIPKGVKDQDIIQIDNLGNEIPLESQRGDGVTRGPIHLVISEKEHPVFKRGIVFNQKVDPSNICMILDISLADAVMGFKKTFEHLDGRKLYFRENEIIKDGDVRIIVGEGLPVKGKDYSMGDLFIKYNVKFPENLTHTQRLEIYKTLTGSNYVDVDIGDEYTYVNNVSINNYGSSKNHAYHSDSDDENNGRGPNVSECKMQ